MANNSGRLECWDPQKMLDLYLHDYLVKKNMHSTAAIFKREANVSEHPVGTSASISIQSQFMNPCDTFIDTEDGFLHEWWSMFYDTYSSRTQPKESIAEGPLQAIQREIEKQFKQPRVPEGLPRVPSQVPTKQKRSRRNTKGNDLMHKWLGIPGGDFDPNLHPLHVNKSYISNSLATSSSHLEQHQTKNAQLQMQDNKYGVSLSGANDAHDAGSTSGNTGQQKGRASNVLNTVTQAADHEQQTQTLTADHEHPTSGDGVKLTSFPGHHVKREQDQKQIQTSTAEHQHPPSDDEMMSPPSRQSTESQHQPDQKQLLEDGGEKKTASRAGDSHLENLTASEDLTVEDTTESFLSYEYDSAGGTSTPFKVKKRRSPGCNKNEERGFTFEEIGALHSNMGKVVCCHFSSNGTLLASAGHEKKVLIWNMETLEVAKSSEEHFHLITDVRFGPNSTIFATSSFDRSVKIWDAAKSSKSISKLEGHSEHVMSVDFHPRKFNLLASCDSNDEIRMWNVKKSICTSVFKGATQQVRFQPRFGKYLAAASGNSVNAFDVETASLDLFSKGTGHANDVLSVCWDTSGKYLASVSEDSARIWSTETGGKCIYELKSNGNRFQSCAFHPGYSLLLIIGCYQSFELWSPSESSKTLTIPAHNGLVAALAASPKTDTVASGSHDHVVKLWK